MDRVRYRLGLALLASGLVLGVAIAVIVIAAPGHIALGGELCAGCGERPLSAAIQLC
jgi:hypothetical protein